MKFKNNTNGHIETVSVPWLWAILFGGLYFIASGLWAPFLIWLIIAIVLYASIGAPATVLMIIVNIIFAALAPMLVKSAYLQKGWVEVTDALPQEPIINEFKKCPFCAEQIKAEAIVCRYCGKDLAIVQSVPLPVSTVESSPSGENPLPNPDARSGPSGER